MEVGKIDLTAIDSTAEMKRVLPSDICDGIIEIIKVLEDRSSLPVAAQIESSLHENLRKWIVKGRAGYAKTGQCHYSGDTSGARRRVGKTYLRINLAQQTAGAVESEHGLTDQVIVEGVRVCKREVPKSIAGFLRETRHRHRAQSDVVPRKLHRLITIHEEEFA